MNRRTSVVFACLLSMVGSSAFAYAESSATINAINFQLIDLVPQDGAASFQFSAGKTALSVSTSDGTVGESDTIAKTRNGTFAFADAFASQLTNASATASISTDQIKTSGSASGSNTSYNGFANTGVSNSYPYYSGTNLTLSAHSMLIITAEASAFASATNPASPSCNYCSPSESASASAGMWLNYSYNSGSTSVNYSFNDALNISAQARGAYVSQELAGYRQVAYTYYDGSTYYYYEPIYNSVSHALQEETKSASKYLTAVFVNSTDTAISANLYFGVTASGLANSAAALPTSVVAVPEADAAWMLLAGIGIVGCVAARRRAR